MATAQYDSDGTATQLLAAGADVDEKSSRPEDIDDNITVRIIGNCGYYAIKHGERTALMYAAANASLSMIKLLLEAGAHPRAMDSQGKTALDCLLGSGPVPANPRLSAEERAQAQALLR